MMGTWDAIQPNGERLKYEDWVVRAWERGALSDPGLALGLDCAVEIRPAGWPLRQWEIEARAKREADRSVAHGR